MSVTRTTRLMWSSIICLLCILITGNLALSKKTKQSSNPNTYSSDTVVNGNLDDHFQTEEKANQWLVVDLERDYNVTTIELYNTFVDGKC